MIDMLTVDLVEVLLSLAAAAAAAAAATAGRAVKTAVREVALLVSDGNLVVCRPWRTREVDDRVSAG